MFFFLVILNIDNSLEGSELGDHCGHSYKLRIQQYENKVLFYYGADGAANENRQI